MSLKENTQIIVEDVTYRYHDTAVLDHVSFTVEKGSYIGVVGPNGGGKTTLLKILVGLLTPDEGKITFFGEDGRHMTKKHLIGYVPQRSSQEHIHFPATVYEIVASGRTPRKGWFESYDENDQTAIEQALQIAGVDAFRDRQLDELSGGQRQRVQVARALAAEPKVLLLDEPFVGIDLAAQEDFYTFLRTLNNKHDITILFVSHDIDVISSEVKEILCLNRRLVCKGPPSAIKENAVIESLYGKKITHIHHDHP